MPDQDFSPVNVGGGSEPVNVDGGGTTDVATEQASTFIEDDIEREDESRFSRARSRVSAGVDDIEDTVRAGGDRVVDTGATVRDRGSTAVSDTRDTVVSGAGRVRSGFDSAASSTGVSVSDDWTTTDDAGGVSGVATAAAERIDGGDGFASSTVDFGSAVGSRIDSDQVAAGGALVATPEPTPATEAAGAAVILGAVGTATAAEIYDRSEVEVGIGNPFSDPEVTVPETPTQTETEIQTPEEPSPPPEVEVGEDTAVRQPEVGVPETPTQTVHSELPVGDPTGDELDIGVGTQQLFGGQIGEPEELDEGEETVTITGGDLADPDELRREELAELGRQVEEQAEWARSSGEEFVEGDGFLFPGDPVEPEVTETFGEVGQPEVTGAFGTVVGTSRTSEVLPTIWEDETAQGAVAQEIEQGEDIGFGPGEAIGFDVGSVPGVDVDDGFDSGPGFDIGEDTGIGQEPGVVQGMGLDVFLGTAQAQGQVPLTGTETPTAEETATEHPNPFENVFHEGFAHPNPTVTEQGGGRRAPRTRLRLPEGGEPRRPEEEEIGSESPLFFNPIASVWDGDTLGPFR